MSEIDLTELSGLLTFSIGQYRSFYFHTDLASQEDALARGLAKLFPAPVHIYRLSGDYLTSDQGPEVQAALLRGDTLILIVNGPHPLAIRFLKMWGDATRGVLTPQGTRKRGGSYFGTVGRHLTFNIERSDNVGILVVLQVGGERQGMPWRHFFKSDEAERLQQLGSVAAGPIVRNVGVHSRAEEASRLTFKDLCLLHLRDHPGGGRVPAPVLANRTTLVSWLDLREIIRSKGHHAERELNELRSKGLLNDEQWNFFELANDFLDTVANTQTRSDVYEAVWRYEFLESDGFYFRGQLRSTWRLDTNLFRPTSNDAVLDVATLVERVQRTSLFLAALRDRQLEFFQGSPSDEELLAVAQHYGFGTPLLDFSRSLRVAAFFATDGQSRLPPDEKALGVIYYLKPDDRRSQQLFDRTESIGLHGFDLLREAGLQFGQWKVLEPGLADSDNRIARQRGIFLEGADVRHLSSVMLEKIEFEHRPGIVFEDPHAGVTKARLLPDSSRLYELAEDVKQRFAAGERTAIHAVMKRISLSRPSIIGVQHAWLDVQVDEAVDFFSSLKELTTHGVGDAFIKQLVASIREYFVSVRLIADLGALPAAEARSTSPASPLERAVIRMCEDSGIDSQQILTTVRDLVPNWEDWTSRAPNLGGDRRLDHWLVLACAVYLVGWEHLTSVQGARSRAFSMQAREIIHLIKSQLKPDPSPEHGDAVVAEAEQ